MCGGLWGGGGRVLGFRVETGQPDPLPALALRWHRKSYLLIAKPSRLARSVGLMESRVEFALGDIREENHVGTHIVVVDARCRRQTALCSMGLSVTAASHREPELGNPAKS